MMINEAGELVHPTRNQYMTVCGGLPVDRDDKGNLTKREVNEVSRVLEVLEKSAWYTRKFMKIWSMFPISEDGILTVNKAGGELYSSPEELLSRIVNSTWKSIGRPVIIVDKETRDLSFYLPAGTWPYLAEDRVTGTLVVEDRIIDIEHVCGLVEDRLSDIMTWCWSKPAFAVVRMVRDLIDHIAKCGFDEAATEKLGFMQKVVHPWANDDWEATYAIANYPYDEETKWICDGTKKAETEERNEHPAEH